MKKLVITIAIVFGLGFGAFAQGGLFGMGPDRQNGDYFNRNDNGGLVELPNIHGSNSDQDSTPLGSGALLLVGLGAAYAIGKRKGSK